MMADTRQLDLFQAVLEPEAEPKSKPSLSAPHHSVPTWIQRDRDLVIRASAGTGKTEALTELYVHWIAGVGGSPIRPSQILATTFTEKAAEEMRSRIRHALFDLVASGGDAAQCETRIARLVCERSEVGSLDLEHVRLGARELNDAPLGTFHSVCAGWLRLYADALGLRADFDVLTEFEAEQIRHDAIVVALRKCVASDLVVADLLDDFRNVEGDFSLIGVLEPILLEILEQGGAPLTMWAAPDSATETRMLTVEAVPLLWRRLIREHRALAEADVPHASSKKVYAKVAQLASDWAEHPRAKHLDSALLVDVAFALAAACGSGKVSEELGAKRVREQVIDGWAQDARQKRRDVVRKLLDAALAEYREAKAQRAALDFSDLLLLTRELLTKHRPARDHLANQLQAIMVDEFQDTNRVQRDLVLALHGSRRGGLVVVGDRKQSIYGFRGADIAVYEGLAQRLMQSGAREHVLRRSYRTHANLLEVVNELSKAALSVRGEEEQESRPSLPFEMHFDAEKEALEPARKSFGTGPSVTLIEPVPDVRSVDQEPLSVARHIASVVRTGSVEIDDGGARRIAGYGDIALLLPRFTKLGDFTRAFDKLRVPYRVLKGRGLLTTTEARDLMSLAALLLDLDDGRGLLAVLRGPMLQLSTAELHALARERPQVFRQPPEQTPWDAVLGAERAQWMSELLRFRRTIDSVGLMNAVEHLLRLSSYRSILLQLPSGEQRVANVDRICSELLVREVAGESPRRLLRELRARAERELDPEADVVGAVSDAVRIMTVHQSKGLQFRVVVAADLGRQIPVPNEKVLYDRDAPGGVAVSVRGPGKWVDGAHYAEVRSVASARIEAEAARLFYVQITRARDHLVLSGLRRSKKSLRVTVVDPVLQRVSPEKVHLAGIPGEPPEARLPEFKGRIAPAVVRQHVPSQAWEVSVTMLEEFARCPRRFRARSLLGDLYDPLVQARSDETSSPRPSIAPVMDARERGTLLHALLEHTDWSAISANAKATEAAWKARVKASGLPFGAQQDLLTRMRAFLQSRYARSLAAKDVTVHRELPFTLNFHVEAGTVAVRGQIDLLVETPKSAHIIDYKATSPATNAPVLPYAFQLAAYALGYRAAHSDHTRMKEVSAGVWFVDGKPRDPIFDDVSVGQAVRDFEGIVDSFARQMAASRFASRRIEVCRSFHCPLISTCHGSEL